MRRCDTLFYDAQCTLCRMWKEWIGQGAERVEGTEAAPPLVFADANDKAHARDLGITDVQRLDWQMCLLRADGTQLWGYDALVGLMRRRPATSGVAWIMGTAPLRRLGDWVYAQVASRRTCLMTRPA